MSRKLVAALACRNTGSRLYGKPLQNLDVQSGYKIIDYIIDSLKLINCIDELILGISEGKENEVFVDIANHNKLKYIVGDETDVLKRLILCGEAVGASDIFRITSESPFLYYQPVVSLWENHQKNKFDATFLDDVVDGCGFEIIKLSALKKSHREGKSKHRSELCSLYIRENKSKFKINQVSAPKSLYNKDLRLTVDNPEDLVLCRAVYNKFKKIAPKIPLEEIILFLDKNPNLIKLTYPYTKKGYKLMYL